MQLLIDLSSFTAINHFCCISKVYEEGINKEYNLTRVWSTVM